MTSINLITCLLRSVVCLSWFCWANCITDELYKSFSSPGTCFLVTVLVRLALLWKCASDDGYFKVCCVRANHGKPTGWAIYMYIYVYSAPIQILNWNQHWPPIHLPPANATQSRIRVCLTIRMRRFLALAIYTTWSINCTVLRSLLTEWVANALWIICTKKKFGALLVVIVFVPHCKLSQSKLSQ